MSSGEAFAFKGIPAVFPIRDASRIVQHIFETVFDELVIDQNAGCATRVGAVDDQFHLRVERLKKRFFEPNRTRDSLFAKHPLVQTIHQREFVSSVDLLLQLLAIDGIHRPNLLSH